MRAVQALVAVLALVLATGSGSGRAETTTLTLGFVLNMASHYGVAASVFAERIASDSQGRYRIQLFPDGKLGGERELVVGAQIGTVDLVLVSTGPVGVFEPATLIADIPFLFRDYAHARAVLDGPIGQGILNQFPPHDLIALAWGENGFRHFTSNGRPVTVPGDLKGLHLRTMENRVHQQAFQSLGAVTTPLPFPKVYAALKSHKVDGEENPIPTIISGRFAEVQKYLSLTAHIYSPALFLMAPRAWQSLTTADQALFRAAAQTAAHAMRAEVDRQDREGLETLRAAGMTVITEIDRSKFQAALAPVYAEFAKSFGPERLEAIRDTRP